MLSLTTIKPRDRDCYTVTKQLNEQTAILKDSQDFSLAESLQLEIQRVKQENIKNLTTIEDARQTFERDCLEQAQKLAMTAEQKLWAENEAFLQKEIEESILQLQEDQEVELKRLEAKLSSDHPKIYFSSKVLGLRKEAETLFKLKEFEKAKEAAALADKEEKAFLAQLEREKIRKADLERKKLYNKHDKEITVLEYKNYLKFCEFWAARNAALAATTQRGKNFKQDMDIAHRDEYINLRARCVDRDIVSNRKSYQTASATFRGSAFLKLTRSYENASVNKSEQIGTNKEMGSK